MDEPSVEAVVRRSYRCYETRDRDTLEGLLSDDFTFTSPRDDHIDRATYWQRCWPNADRIKRIDIRRLFVKGDEAFILYELTPASGGKFRNTEFMRLENGKIKAVEVYFGDDDDAKGEK